jgi:LAO/AO transport system kinase
MSAGHRSRAKAAKSGSQPDDIAALAGAVKARDRRALARAITLIESTRAEDQPRAEALLAELLPRAGQAFRIGITGAPGVGKSTFIEAFGRYLTGQGHRVAVLAVDPTSRISGGAILGDKTRMAELARDANAFIRPSPAGRSLGGVARRTREAMLLAEAAGYDVVLVETVGVGQSDTLVADMVDVFVLLLAPAAGDDLQGIKRGVMELADLIIVTKADGELQSAAQLTEADFRSALQLLRPRFAGWRPRVMRVSALHRHGIGECWQALAEFRAALVKASEFARRREAQDKAWLTRELAESLLEHVAASPEIARLLPEFEAGVAAGHLLPRAAARRLLACVLSRPPGFRPGGKTKSGATSRKKAKAAV